MLMLMAGGSLVAGSDNPHFGTLMPFGPSTPSVESKFHSQTRVTGFLWDRGRDRLWRQGIDLIGDDRRRKVSESIEDGAMLGKSEGGEFLDVTDDGLDDIAPVEQGLVEERHR